ncbi:MAG TPA: hypothetical protein VG365_03970 [Solirubrobacteraceae bacterium]|jgi:hypothetical protein|nr:hypothetical protein [Solirubrobacteraceae bacterium]
MASNDPNGQSGSSGPAEGGDDALSRLEQRLDAASEAAERLLADAAARATGRPPPSGWQQPKPEAGQGAGGGVFGGAGGGLFGGDGDLLLGLLASIRDRIPPEIQQRLAEAVREVLLALRALIDWYLERTGRRGPEPAEVQDIPIL